MWEFSLETNVIQKAINLSTSSLFNPPQPRSKTRQLHDFHHVRAYFVHIYLHHHPLFKVALQLHNPTERKRDHEPLTFKDPSFKGAYF